MAGLRQKEVADLAGLNPSHVCLIELGKRKPSVAAVDKLSKALKVPNHLFVLLGAESGDLKTNDPNEIHRAAESLAHLLFDAPQNHASGQPELLDGSSTCIQWESLKPY